MTSSPVPRTTARVVPVNARGQVLLLLGHDPARPDEPYWFTIGGGTEPGETIEEAAVRELREETGIELAADALGTPFHHGEHVFTYDQVEYVAQSTFFAVRLDDVEISHDGIDEDEVIMDAGWWDPDSLVGTAVSNLQLPELMRQAVTHVLGPTG